MKIIKLICNNCGCETTILDTELYDDTKCILCGGPMKIKQEALFGVLIPHWIDTMRHNIEILGNRRVWEIIENFHNPKTRLAYRKLFFQAGGKID